MPLVQQVLGARPATHTARACSMPGAAKSDAGVRAFVGVWSTATGKLEVVDYGPAAKESSPNVSVANTS